MKHLSQRAQRLRDAGYKLTTARLTVLDVLEQSDEHLTSTEVLDAVAAVNPAIGRASVFRTLDLLTRLNIVRPTYIDSSMTPCYVMLPGGHHHHIVCVQCNRLFEFHDCGLNELSRQLEQKFDVQLTGHLLEFYGICQACRKRNQEETKGSDG
jgi:Fur family ferric uptake transcriptional regulator